MAEKPKKNDLSLKKTKDTEALNKLYDQLDQLPDKSELIELFEYLKSYLINSYRADHTSTTELAAMGVSMTLVFTGIAALLAEITLIHDEQFKLGVLIIIMAAVFYIVGATLLDTYKRNPLKKHLTEEHEQLTKTLRKSGYGEYIDQLGTYQMVYNLYNYLLGVIEDQLAAENVGEGEVAAARARIQEPISDQKPNWLEEPDDNDEGDIIDTIVIS